MAMRLGISYHKRDESVC